MNPTSEEIVEELRKLIALLLPEGVEIVQIDHEEDSGGLQPEHQGWQMTQGGLLLRWYTGGHAQGDADLVTVELMGQDGTLVMNICYTLEEERDEGPKWCFLSAEAGDLPDDIPSGVVEGIGRMESAVYQGHLNDDYDLGFQLVAQLIGLLVGHAT